MMCWLYYKFERMMPFLGQDAPPTVLYEGSAITGHELIFLRILSRIGADLLVETLRRMEEGTLVPEPQDEAFATYEPKLEKTMGEVDFRRSAREVADQVLALNPWPCCSIPFGGGRLKLLRARTAEGSGTPGEILAADPGAGLVLACGEGAVQVTELQAAGGKAMAARDYFRGHPWQGSQDVLAAEGERI